MAEELFDIVDEATGEPTGEVRPRSQVHAEGLFHRAVHVWLWDPSAGPPGGELLLQRRADVKDSWPGRWDISSAGHLSTGDTPLQAAVRELGEELGLHLPSARFDRLFVHLERLASTQRGRAFLNHEFNTVFLVTVTREERIAMGRQGGLTLQAAEVSAVRWATVHEVRRMYEEGDASLVPTSVE